MTSIARSGEGHGEPRPPLYREALRPQFHFTARYWKDHRLGPGPHQEGWMNDMNGLVWNDGVYHLFCQRWWSAWLHAVGTDLVHWEEREPAFGKGGRFGGTQSGGCVVDRENSSGLGDGGTPPMVAFWSSTDNANQCISYSRDRGRTWRKYEKNPVLAHPYRDPNVFWYGPARKWIMILYGPAGEKGGGAGRYGFNGESNDAHDLLPYRAGEWKCSVVRLHDDGRVAVDDQDGRAVGRIDIARQNVGADAFYVGAKASGGELLKGDVAEILVYDRPLSDEETARAIAGVRAKWGLTGPGGRVPTDGLVLRLDAARAEADGEGRVAVWRDVSGKGRGVRQPDAARMPRLVPGALLGLPAIRFAGAQFFRGEAPLAEGTDRFTIVALWRRDGTDGSEVVCEQNSSGKVDGRRACLLATGEPAPGDRYLLFSSTNLLEWAKLDSSIADSFECPDMFPLAVEGERREAKWVVVDGRGDYLVGRFDGEHFAAEQAKRTGDFGRNFYATMTFNNMPERDGRRVQMAWMRDMDGYPKDMPFSQQASFPCELTLRRLPEGLVLCRNPVREIEKLHVQKLSLRGCDLGEGENPLGDIEGELFDIRAEIDVAGSTCDRVVFRLRGNIVTYDLRAKRLASQGSEAALPPRSGAVEIRILVDRLSLETFGNRGEVSITNVARQADSRPHLSLGAVGGVCRVRSLAVRGVKSIWQ